MDLPTKKKKTTMPEVSSAKAKQPSKKLFILIKQQTENSMKEELKITCCASVVRKHSKNLWVHGQ